MNLQSTYQNLSDSELYTICKRYGLQTLDARRKFAGTLPEVFKRRLYRRRGYTSIYEFAAKLAGMNQNSVDQILQLSNRLNDKPLLKEQLESGAVGWSKLRVVSSLATPKTDSKWAEKTKKLTKKALEICVQNHNATTFTESQNDHESFPGEGFQPGKSSEPFQTRSKRKTIHFKVSPQLEKKFRLFKHELEKERKETLSFAETLEALLNREDTKTNKNKPKNKANANEKRRVEKTRKITGKTVPSRYIPVHIRQIIKKKYEGSCAFPGCYKAATKLHHTQRFALEKNHDPNKIVPLCDAHEQLVHSGMIENEESPPKTWRVQKLEENPRRDMGNHEKNYIDQLVWLYR